MADKGDIAARSKSSAMLSVAASEMSGYAGYDKATRKLLISAERKMALRVLVSGAAILNALHEQACWLHE
jgi:hypothetical protein